jgi:hypothetical protein
MLLVLALSSTKKWAGRSHHMLNTGVVATPLAPKIRMRNRNGVDLLPSPALWHSEDHPPRLEE